MPARSIAIAAFAIFANLPPHAYAAEPAHAALIIGNATYSALPGVPGCAKSANTVAAALRALGFQVTGLQDASTGGVDAGIGEFSQHLAPAGSSGFVYICGYGTDFNERTFVLPTTARIERPSDVLTQGVLAKSLLSTVSRDPATLGVVVFDMIPKPDGPPKLGLDALTALPVPDGVGIIAATEPSAVDNPTPLATALVAALAGPVVRTDGILASVRTQLAGATVSGLAIHMPAHPGILAGAQSAPATAPGAAPATTAPGAAPATTSPSAPSPSVASAAPPVATAPSPPVASAPSPPVTSAPPEQSPEEARMTDGDRRKVQTALVRLGYYDNPVDGLFGPETRAAIRRYQHEIGAETTGRLTADQATKLVNTR
jgi:hypothetical protein